MQQVADQTETRKTLDVLIADDDAEIAAEIADCLSRVGLACKTVGDGWAALKLFAEGWDVAVVVSDLRMPELNGLQFAEHLHNLARPRRPEIIFISGSAGFDDAVEAIRLQARDMLTKPVDAPRLIRAVKSARLVREMRSPVGRAPAKPEKTPVQRRRATLESLRAVRKVRSRFFPSELFSDPCWEMLLDLYDGKLAGQEVTITSLAAASGAATTTAWRRISALQAHGLIERKEDPSDKRRIMVRLTPNGLKAVEEFFETYSGKVDG